MPVDDSVTLESLHVRFHRMAVDSIGPGTGGLALKREVMAVSPHAQLFKYDGEKTTLRLVRLLCSLSYLDGLLRCDRRESRTWGAYGFQ